MRGATGAGQPLPAGERAFFEPRLGADLSDVRVHHGPHAEAAADAVQARAFTVGRNVVFGAGEYRPGSSDGRRLMAHELAHVMQQSAGGERLQRFPACESGEDCPARVPGEIRRSRTEPHQVSEVSGAGLGTGLLIANFGVDQSRAKADLASNPFLTTFLSMMAARADLRWEVLGFSDCQGTETLNTTLREQRAVEMLPFLFPVRARIDRFTAAPVTDCIMSNASETGRTLNRSAFIRLTSTEITMEEEHVEGSRFICGPDVTNELDAAIARLYGRFGSLTASEQEDVCDTLDSYTAGLYTWDIVELHNNAWIHRDYRPDCATAGATPACGSSVQVGDQCYYAGSANYVIFGHMCRLCFDKYMRERRPGAAYDYSRSSMLDLVDLYKGSGPLGLSTPSGNYIPSRQWAEAGWNRWRAGDRQPRGDRNNCAPHCPTPLTGQTFNARWCPHIDPAGQCP